MGKFIKKEWYVSKDYHIFDGFNMKPGFLYSIDIETGNLVDIVTYVDDDMEYITVFHKTNDNKYERHEYFHTNIHKHIMDMIYVCINDMEDRRIFYPYPSKKHCYKMAMDFIENKKCPYGTYTEEFQAFDDGRPPVYKKFARFPSETVQIIYKYAHENGWDGCHWDNPLILDIDDEY